jgi:hypothetical protein
MSHLYTDVVLQDSTYKTNRFGMALSLFTVIDSNGCTRITASSFLCVEDIESFEWMFGMYKSAIDGKNPKVLFTDADTACETAISNVWPSTRHFWCIFHIDINITST